MKIKQLMTVLAAAVLVVSVEAANMSLPDARAKIGACIANSKELSSVIKQLSSADQIAFLAEVNEAIGKMPGSNESKAAAFLVANRAAVMAVEPADKIAMFAEVYATVPPEVLTVVNESFASELMSRSTGDSQKVTDEQFVKTATEIMKKVNERCASVENGAVRATFAALMLIRADGGKVADLPETLVKTIPESAQNAARTEWIPAALGQSQEKTYLPLLGAADNVGDMAANDMVIRLVGPQLLESMLGDVVEGTPLINNSNRPEMYNTPVRDDEDKTQAPVDPAHNPDPGDHLEDEEPQEPKPYQS